MKRGSAPTAIMVLFALLALVSCQRGSLERTSPVITKVPVPRPTPSFDATSRAALPSTQSPSEQLPSAAQERSTGEPAGSTLGTIACGAVRCQAGREVCAFSPQPDHCAEATEYAAGGAGLFCDDTSDCPKGRACCQIASSSELVQRCTAPSGPATQCQIEVCKVGGAPCPRGRHCEQEFCDRDRASSCPGADEPSCGPRDYCQWNDGRTHCAAEPYEVQDVNAAQAVFGCIKPSDCGPGQSCCTSPVAGWRQTRCATGCDLANNLALCERTSECRALLVQFPLDVQRVAEPRCTPVAEGAPPWLRACHFGVP